YTTLFRSVRSGRVGRLLALRYHQQRVCLSQRSKLSRSLSSARSGERLPSLVPDGHTQECPAPRVLANRFQRSRLHSQPTVAAKIKHGANHRPHEELEGHERADRVAWQPNHGDPRDLPYRQRLPGLDRDSPEVQAPGVLEDATHVVVLADADATRGDDQIRPRSRP